MLIRCRRCRSKTTFSTRTSAHAASVTAALAVLRSLLGALLPLGGLQMYNALGLGWGNSLLAFVSLALVPIPFCFYIWGERLRQRFPLENL